MSPARYPLSPSAWGAAVEVPVAGLIQASLFSDLGSASGTSYVDVTLHPNPLSGTWRVRYAGGVLGEITANLRELFPDIGRIHAAGLVPSTLAGVRLNPGSGLFDATVYLPPAPLAVPRGDAPAGARLLPPGDMYVVDTSTGEFSGGELAEASPGQWLVGLSPVGGAVVVTLGGRVLGSVAEDEAAEVRALMGAVLDDAPVAARAYALDGMVGLDLAAPDGPCPEVPPLPPAPVVPAPAAENGPPVTEFPDGTWAVTVERYAAVDPGDVVEPSPGARRIGLPGTGAPEDAPQPQRTLGDLVHVGDVQPPEGPAGPGIDFTPTRTWHISAGNYLTEVEKVRLRREARRRTGSGRHRLAD